MTRTPVRVADPAGSPPARASGPPSSPASPAPRSGGSRRGASRACKSAPAAGVPPPGPALLDPRRHGLDREQAGALAARAADGIGKQLDLWGLGGGAPLSSAASAIRAKSFSARQPRNTSVMCRFSAGTTRNAGSLSPRCHSASPARTCEGRSSATNRRPRGLPSRSFAIHCTVSAREAGLAPLG